MQEATLDDILGVLHEINDPLIVRGRFVAPILVQNQFGMQVQSLCRELSNESDESKIQLILRKIDQLVSLHWFSPLIRSWQCHRASELPLVKNFSHMLEQATLHYFRQDYLSAMMILVPVIEGIMLRQSGTPITEFKSWGSHKSFLLSLTSDYPQPESIKRFEHYRDFLVKFLDERFFCRGEKAALSFGDSVLNRNFILHMLGDEPFYSQHDCQTLFQLIDLYMEVIVCQRTDTYFHCWIKSELGQVTPREKHYWSIILNNYLGIGDMDTEENFLKSHSNYSRQQESTNYFEMFEEGPPRLTALTQALMQTPDFLFKAILTMPKIEETKQKLLTTACEAVVLCKNMKPEELLAGTIEAKFS